MDNQRALAGLCEAALPLIAGDGEDQTMLPMQCRAARGLLGWTQHDLSHRAGVSIGTIRGFEATQTSPIPATLAAIRMALEKGGVIFTDGDEPGVKMKRKGRKPK
jgi:hypothetical protein